MNFFRSVGSPLVSRWWSAGRPLESRKFDLIFEGVIWCTVGGPSVARWWTKFFIPKNEANYLSFGEVRLPSIPSRHTQTSYPNSQNPFHPYQAFITHLHSKSSAFLTISS